MCALGGDTDKRLECALSWSIYTRLVCALVVGSDSGLVSVLGCVPPMGLLYKFNVCVK